MEFSLGKSCVMIGKNKDCRRVFREYLCCCREKLLSQPLETICVVVVIKMDYRWLNRRACVA